MAKTTYVIAISGPSGAGKTTLAKNLLSLFGDAFMLGIDHYPADHYPAPGEWLERGADPDEFETMQFFADVRSLKNGEAITHPETQQQVGPPAYLILEEPFGKSRTALKDLIDLHAEVDIPLEIALARRLLRMMDMMPEAETLPFIKGQLTWYLHKGRTFYLAVQDNARKDKDLTVDGTLPSETLAQTIFEAVIAIQNIPR